MKLATAIRNIIGVVGLPFTIWNLITNQKNKVKPPGQIIKTKHSDVHVLMTGEGPSTVILEAGLSSISIDWCYVQPEISKHARVISYDRGNYGWSKSRRKTMTARDSVEELKEILTKLKIPGPYLLVGHSYGGLSVRLFASMYPNDVIGLVLEDAVHEKQYSHAEQKSPHMKKFRNLLKLGYITSLVGLPRMLKRKVGRTYLAKEYDQSLKYVNYTLGAYKSFYREYLDTEKSAVQLTEAKPLKEDLPILVISAKKQTEAWKQNQQLLTALTKRTEQIQADVGHSIHLEQPQIVIDGILQLLNLKKEQ